MYNTDLLVLGELSFGLIEEFGVCSDEMEDLGWSQVTWDLTR